MAADPYFTDSQYRQKWTHEQIAKCKEYYETIRPSLMPDRRGQIIVIQRAYKRDENFVYFYDTLEESEMEDKVPNPNPAGTELFIWTTRVGEEESFSNQTRRKKKNKAKLNLSLGSELSLVVPNCRFFDRKDNSISTLVDCSWDSGADEPSLRTQDLGGQNFRRTFTEFNDQTEVPAVKGLMLELQGRTFGPFIADIDDDWAAIGASVSKHFDVFMAVRSQQSYFSSDALTVAPAISVTFTATFVEAPNERLFVLGDSIQLGKWGAPPRSLNEGLELRKNATGIWHASAVLPRGIQFEWKFVLECLGVIRWEHGPNGSNRIHIADGQSIHYDLSPSMFQ
eukprot:TRINITY_DN11100_c0_g1_i1.p1 TRINITY_DN11100_c0_g1~~TRINITY_DN11100_c0_g1_i1.p1  ORF type:complete len:352 (-),score=43.12 TRINITY_DN11100_c0_g1_i1:219-1235(-)